MSLSLRSENSTPTAAELYLDLLIATLANTVYGKFEHRELESSSLVRRIVKKLAAQQGATVMKPTPMRKEKREEGRDWPPHAHTMAGLKRLRSLAIAVRTVIEEGVPGDLIETGAWRGGCSILMAGALKAYAEQGRKVWVADSFCGLPPPDDADAPDQGDRHHTMTGLAVSLDDVRENFAAYGLLDGNVEFLQGWFKDTLPAAAIDSLAVMRLDGDMYGSTKQALEALYPKLAPGGYVIIDDYGNWAPCRQAVDEFRTNNQIDDEIVEVDWTCVYWRKPGSSE